MTKVSFSRADDRLLHKQTICCFPWGEWPFCPWRWWRRLRTLCHQGELEDNEHSFSLLLKFCSIYCSTLLWELQILNISRWTFFTNWKQEAGGSGLADFELERLARSFTRKGQFNCYITIDWWRVIADDWSIIIDADDWSVINILHWRCRLLLTKQAASAQLTIIALAG